MAWISWRNLKPWLEQALGAFRGASLPAESRDSVRQQRSRAEEAGSWAGIVRTNIALYNSHVLCFQGKAVLFVYFGILSQCNYSAYTGQSLCWTWVLHIPSRMGCSHSGCDVGFWIWLFLGKGRGEQLQPRFRSRYCSCWVGGELPPVYPSCLGCTHSTHFSACSDFGTGTCLRNFTWCHRTRKLTLCKVLYIDSKDYQRRINRI